MTPKDSKYVDKLSNKGKFLLKIYKIKTNKLKISPRNKFLIDESNSPFSTNVSKSLAMPSSI
jgi:hydrogenase maturation factor HypF (carbamoyltransferase family)